MARLQKRAGLPHRVLVFLPLRPLGRIQTMITIIVMMRRIIVMMMHTMVPRRYDAMNLIRRQRCEAAPPAM